MDILGLLGVVAVILAILVFVKVLVWGIPIAVVLLIVGLALLAGGFYPRIGGRGRI